MSKFRKKPVVIEAFLHDPSIPDNHTREFPSWFITAIRDKKIEETVDKPPKLRITTLEGIMYASAGDYVIQGVKGEIYPCKPDIFEATYEKAE